jgi:hypothetical protein
VFPRKEKGDKHMYTPVWEADGEGRVEEVYKEGWKRYIRS